MGFLPLDEFMGWFKFLGTKGVWNVSSINRLFFSYLAYFYLVVYVQRGKKNSKMYDTQFMLFL